jgi:HD-GYP domain-containing protein (c-di-GMP phosphodiesterase class II)
MGMREAPLALLMVAIVVATLAVDALLSAVVRAGTDRAPFLAVLRNEGTAQAGIGSAIGATGALIALAATIMTVWALPVFVVPLLLTQFAFRRYAAIRESSLQTIRALSRVTELGGYTESGHSRRVSQLSMAVGRELGMNDAELRDLEYAALMHDIGQLSLAEPIPGGATVVAAPADQRRIASLGADVIRQTGVPDEVAEIVDLQAEPYRRAHESQRSEIPLAARIIKAVNAYDDLVGDSYEVSRQLEALERLRLGMAYEYDPTVVESLSKTVERTARLGV